MTRADGIVIACALGFVGALYGQFWGGGTSSGEARIVAGSDEFGRYSLFEERRIEVPGPAGTTVVEVRDGAVRCAESPGPNRVCQQAGWLRHGGEMAVSLPNRVLIEVVAADRRFDSVNF
ncbi:MAG: NusG domain II-containing protein [Chromatiales bacterium]|jgi:hypothetical protein|nr:NusG domain II-containing protein [Chromatiales bacterium]MDX9767438.1 NusG domain II-containing protein [Ectothiorhodospiraceae bacterium]